MDHNTAIVWFRRDLRLADNPALHHALQHHRRLLAVYIHAPEEEAPWAPGAASRWWLHHALAALDRQLRRTGTALLLRQGHSLQQLLELVQATGAGAVYWNRLYEPALTARDRQIEQGLRQAGVQAESFNAALLAEPWQVQTGAGEPYRVFTPFWKALSTRLPQQAPLPAPQCIEPPAAVPEGLPLDRLQLLPRIDWAAEFRTCWTPGEAGAWQRLETFCDAAAAHYREQRDQPALEATSRLSPHLQFGEISPRQILARLRRLTAGEPRPDLIAGVDHYLRELGWREFAHHLLHHFPQTAQQPLNPRFAAFPWRRPPDYAADLRAWQRGGTGIALVDAGMRQLWRSGWMHNRVRMVVASFLSKNLLIPWQEGAAWFWDTLVDANLANNTLGWQWTAGCGADAAPYFRVFNPVSQGEKFDPDGVYRQRWTEAMPPGEAIVDLAVSRRRALAAYAKVKHPQAPSDDGFPLA